MVICLERGADMPPTVSCCSKIQTGLTFLEPARPSIRGQRAFKWVLLLYTKHGETNIVISGAVEGFVSAVTGAA